MLTYCNGLLKFCDVPNGQEPNFMNWFLHGGLQYCYFVSIEFPKSSNLGHIWFLHGGLKLLQIILKPS